jgi:hypothetical protein
MQPFFSLHLSLLESLISPAPPSSTKPSIRYISRQVMQPFFSPFLTLHLSLLDSIISPAPPSSTKPSFRYISRQKYHSGVFFYTLALNLIAFHHSTSDCKCWFRSIQELVSCFFLSAHCTS